MTVIAYRDGILAADTSVWGFNNIKIGVIDKIMRIDGKLFTACGDAARIMQVRQWVTGGMKEHDKPRLNVNDLHCLLILPSGYVMRFGGDLVDQRTQAPFHAIGCKPEFTLGALYAGATAEEAVRLTLENTDAGHGTIQVEHI